jgi:hypothetical protein
MQFLRSGMPEDATEPQAHRIAVGALDSLLSLLSVGERVRGR